MDRTLVARHAAGRADDDGTEDRLVVVRTPGPPPRRPRGVDVTRVPAVAWWLRHRSWQFQVTLPNAVLFWVVVVLGFVGVDDFGLNFATTLTWFVWFGLVFVLVALTGRGWCAVCPFGGMAEWLQRGRLWHGRGVASRRLGRLAPPTWLTRWGYVPTAVMFGVLTWVEEYFEVPDGAPPERTSWTVAGIVLLALVTFALFDRRTFCRHLCPLGGLVGTLGAGAPVRGFRARDRQVCLDCTTRDCLRGNASAYGCPWFDWPGGSTSNIGCGLCGECFRACPSDNVGLFVDLPFAGLARERERRADVAWTVAVIGGLMAAQHVRTAPLYDRVDAWTLRAVGLPHGPDPLLFAALAAVCVAVLAAPAWLSQAFLRTPRPAVPPRRDRSFLHRTGPFRERFLPLAYASIPLLAADFVAVELLGFATGAPRAVAALARLAGSGPALVDRLGGRALASPGDVVVVQVSLLAVGALASAGIAWRTAAADLLATARTGLAVRAFAAALMALAGVLVVLVYVVTGGEAG